MRRLYDVHSLALASRFRANTRVPLESVCYILSSLQRDGLVAAAVASVLSTTHCVRSRGRRKGLRCYNQALLLRDSQAPCRVSCRDSYKTKTV